MRRVIPVPVAIALAVLALASCSRGGTSTKPPVVFSPTATASSASMAASGTPAAASSATAPIATPVSTACASNVAVTTITVNPPNNDQPITNGNNGVTFKGSACLAPGEVIYALEATGSDADTGPFTMDGPSEDQQGPVVTVSGTFSFLDKPIGDGTPDAEMTKVYFVAGNKACQTILGSTDPDETDRILLGPPCKILRILQLTVSN